MRQYFPVLTIAGSDSSGGAGIQADIKTMSAIGCYAMSAITSITAQNTTGVRSIQPILPEIVTDQIEMVVADIPPLAIKTGMLCDAEVSRAVIDCLAEMSRRGTLRNLVVDPVMVSTSGSQLLEDGAIDVIVEKLLPLAEIVTPNRMEAVRLTGESEPVAQARRFREMGCRNVLLKGGDSGRTDVKTDWLSLDGSDQLIPLTADCVETRNTHGTGCTLSSAIASYLALGCGLEDAVRRGKLYITRALQAGAFVTVGRGHGPVNHFFNPRHLKNYNPKHYGCKD